MARAYLLFVLLLSVALNAQNSKLIATSCHADGRRCTGSSYCTACSNCSGCAHCNSGGSCGVCSSYSAPKTVYSKPAKKNKVSTTKRKSPYSSSKKPAAKKSSSVTSTHLYTAPKTQVSATVYVISEILNLRDGPGTEYAVIETLDKGDEMVILDHDGDWAQVIVDISKNVGYVKSIFVK